MAGRNDDNSLASSFAIISGDEGNDFSPLFQPASVLTSANRTRYSLLFEVRPTIRWDFFGGPDSGSIKPYRDGTRDAQLLLGFNAIQRF